MSFAVAVFNALCRCGVFITRCIANIKPSSAVIALPVCGSAKSRTLSPKAFWSALVKVLVSVFFNAKRPLGVLPVTAELPLPLPNRAFCVLSTLPSGDTTWITPFALSATTNDLPLWSLLSTTQLIVLLASLDTPLICGPCVYWAKPCCAIASLGIVIEPTATIATTAEIAFCSFLNSECNDSDCFFTQSINPRSPLAHARASCIASAVEPSTPSILFASA